MKAARLHPPLLGGPGVFIRVVCGTLGRARTAVRPVKQPRVVATAACFQGLEYPTAAQNTDCTSECDLKDEPHLPCARAESGALPAAGAPPYSPLMRSSALPRAERLLRYHCFRREINAESGHRPRLLRLGPEPVKFPRDSSHLAAAISDLRRPS